MIKGVATSIYGTDENATISLAELSSTGKRSTFVTRDTRFRINPDKPAEVREGMLEVGKTIASFGARAMKIAGNSTIYPPLFVNFGTSQDSPHDFYAQVLRNAFPEYSFPSNVSMHELLYLLLYSLSQKNKGENFPVVWNMNTYHGGNFSKGEKPAEGVQREDDNVSRKIETLLALSEMGMLISRGILTSHVLAEATIHIMRLKILGIFDSTRFVRIGSSDSYFKGRTAFTYIHRCIGDVSLRDIYATFFIKRLKKPHNVCIKGPESPSAPPFADINATHIADYWDTIYNLSGTPISYGHVEARMS